MKIGFDTSTLVAALLQQHPHHSSASRRLQEIRRKENEGALTTHGVAELFSTLTAIPLKPRLLPPDAERLIEKSVLAHFELIPLGTEEYRAAMQLAVTKNLPSGAIYDALHVVGARSAGCQILLTLNPKHFRILAPEDGFICSP